MKRTYLDTLNTDFDYLYDFYVEGYESGGEEPAGRDSREFHEYVNDVLQSEAYDFLSDLRRSKNNGPCVVFGTVGTWTGRHEIEPKKFDTVEEAIYACCDRCDYYTISQEYSALKVEAAHHDGRNYFTIKLLNSRGLDTERGYLSNRRYHKTIKGDFLGM